MLPDRHAAFRAQLLDAGVLVELGPGLYGRSAAFEDVADALIRFIAAAGSDQGATTLRFPPVLPRTVFERTDYLASFPNLIGAVFGFDGDDRAHADLLARWSAGERWDDALQLSDVMLCPAVCHPLYPTLRGRQPAGGRTFDVLGHCYRSEPAVDPARMQAFRQYEFVYVGEADGAAAFRDRWVDRAAHVLSAVGLTFTVGPANDPFFGRAGRMLAANQRVNELKTELTVRLYGEDEDEDGGEGTACASVNRHLDHFGAAFGLETGAGEVAHTACVGFGVERLTLALLRTHGFDRASWPAQVRSALWP